MNETAGAPAAGSGRRPGAPRWLRPLAGTAIAASVAVAALSVVVNLQAPGSGPAVEPFTSPNSAGLAPVSQPASFDPASTAQRRSMNRYLIRHNQAAGAVGQKGFVSFVPIVVTTPVQVIETPETAEPGTEDTATGNDVERP